MNDLIPIKVSSYSETKADEYPKSFYWGNTRFDINEILDRWYQGGQSQTFPAPNYFKVSTSGGKIFLLKHEIKNDKWFLYIKGESINLSSGLKF